MGGGSWTISSFENYSVSTGKLYNPATNTIIGNSTAQEMFKSRRLDPMLNPKGVIRECCDSEEHPKTVPVIIGLDVTGSMGPAGVEVAKKLGVICEALYEKIPHVQIMVMGIGDLSTDDAPIQVGQFESDVRIAEQLDKIWFEFGGGGNCYESYSAAWLFGSRRCKLDCWNRGQRGVIITTGDEPLNPYLPRIPLNNALGTTYEADIETPELFKEASKKFDIYHITVKDGTCYHGYESKIKSTFGKILEPQHLIASSIENLSTSIVDIVVKHVEESAEDLAPQTPFVEATPEADSFQASSGFSQVFSSNEISW